MHKQTFGSAVLIASLAACGVPGATAIGQGTTQNGPAVEAGSAAGLFESHARSSIKSDKKSFRDVIYVDGGGYDVYAYSNRPPFKVLEKLTWQKNLTSFPLSLATDSHANLYVGVGGGDGHGPCCGDIDVFPPGAKQPGTILDIQDYSAYTPHSIAVSRDGYVAATLTEAGATSPSTVMIFKPGQTAPCANVTSAYFGTAEFLASAFDRKGDIYVAAYNGSSESYAVGEVEGLCKAKTIAQTKFDFSNGSPYYLQVDAKDNLAVAVSTSSSRAIDIFPPGSTNPSEVVELDGVIPYSFTFGSKGTTLWASEYYGGAAEFNYPSGGEPIEVLPPPYGSAELTAIAVSPPEEP